MLARARSAWPYPVAGSAISSPFLYSMFTKDDVIIRLLGVGTDGLCLLVALNVWASAPLAPLVPPAIRPRGHGVGQVGLGGLTPEDCLLFAGLGAVLPGLVTDFALVALEVSPVAADGGRPRTNPFSATCSPSKNVRLSAVRTPCRPGFFTKALVVVAAAVVCRLGRGLGMLCPTGLAWRGVLPICRTRKAVRVHSQVIPGAARRCAPVLLQATDLI